MSFYGREAEMAFLRERWSKKAAEFLVFWGKRRIGKTELVKQFTSTLFRNGSHPNMCLRPLIMGFISERENSPDLATTRETSTATPPATVFNAHSLSRLKQFTAAFRPVSS
jgi:hypothetical protein